eukprot:1443500-Amphidinium_carterae.3
MVNAHEYPKLVMYIPADRPPRTCAMLPLDPLLEYLEKTVLAAKHRLLHSARAELWSYGHCCKLVVFHMVCITSLSHDLTSSQKVR